MAFYVAQLGQSNMRKWFTDSDNPGTPDALLKVWNGSIFDTPIGNGDIAFGNFLVALLGGSTEVRLFNMAVGSTALTVEAGDVEYWNDPTSDLYTDFQAVVLAETPSNNLDLVIWGQGERDSQQMVPQETWNTACQALFNRIRADFTNSNGSFLSIPIVIQPTGRNTSTPSGFYWQGTRQAQYQVEAAMDDVIVAGHYMDLPIVNDGFFVHLEPAEYSVVGTRVFNAYSTLLGNSIQYKGPSFNSTAKVSSTQTRISLSQQGGSTLKPATGITGFLVNGLTATGVTESATSVLLTHAATVDFRRSDSLYGANPDITGILLDNNDFPVQWGFQETSVATAIYTNTFQDTGVDISTTLADTGQANKDVAAYASAEMEAVAGSPNYATSNAAQKSAFVMDLVPFTANYTVSGQFEVIVGTDAQAGGLLLRWDEDSPTEDGYQLLIQPTNDRFRIQRLGGSVWNSDWAVTLDTADIVDIEISVETVGDDVVFSGQYQINGGGFNPLIDAVDDEAGNIQDIGKLGWYSRSTAINTKIFSAGAVYDIEAGVSPTLPTPYPDLTNLPGDAGQQDFSSDWIGASTFQISGLPQGAHQVESSALVDFTFPSVDGWYDLADVNVVALSSDGTPSQVESFNWTVSNRMAANFTQKPQVLSDPFDDASSPVTVLRGAMASAQWSQVSFKVFDASGDPIDTAVGVVSGKARATGQGDFSDFAATIDLNVDDWVFLPNQAAIEEFEFSVTGLTADFTIVATVTSWI